MGEVDGPSGAVEINPDFFVGQAEPPFQPLHHQGYRNLSLRSELSGEPGAPQSQIAILEISPWLYFRER